MIYHDTVVAKDSSTVDDIFIRLVSRADYNSSRTMSWNLLTTFDGFYWIIFFAPFDHHLLMLLYLPRLTNANHPASVVDSIRQTLVAIQSNQKKGNFSFFLFSCNNKKSRLIGKPLTVSLSVSIGKWLLSCSLKRNSLSDVKSKDSVELAAVC